jgi:tetratricopeptide (TPR) repeat protein
LTRFQRLPYTCDTPFSAASGGIPLQSGRGFSTFISAWALCACVCLSSPATFAQEKPAAAPKPAPKATLSVENTRIGLETSEALFSTLAAINSCGFDYELGASEPLRQQVREAVAHVLATSVEADNAHTQLCNYYRDKQQPDPARELSQYVSLALNVEGPPFVLATKEAELPPDAANLLGFLPYLQRFHDAIELHDIWRRAQPVYDAQLARMHAPIREMILKTDLYLKMQQSSYITRRFSLYVEPMGAPGQVNARNYGSDYFLVVTPSSGPLRMDEIRHTYLHYILDPLTQKRANQLKPLESLLEMARSAPIDDSYKQDASLMVIESLIRAIEARTYAPATMPAAKNKKAERELEEQRSQLAQAAMEQGFILTRYFYDALDDFEKGPAGLKDAFADMLRGIDVGRERKRIAEIKFGKQAPRELVGSSRIKSSGNSSMLDVAEQRLAENDPQAAHKIAQQVLDEKSDDPARALFILARAATLSKEIPEAQALFERTLEVAREPRTVAWSHIYLGRILDRMCNRDKALDHYRAALAAGDSTPDTKTAADKGLQAPPPNCAEEKRP